MDHISLPKNPIQSPIQVSYRVTESYKYDGQGFSGFPERKKFDIQKLKSAEFQSSQWDDALSFLQQWAFFGMIADILGGSGLPVKLDDFICEREGQQFITTEFLPYYLRLWASRESILDETAKEERLGRTDLCLAEIHRHINGIVKGWGSLEAEASESHSNISIPSAAHSTLLSILILGESLSFGRYSCYGVGIARLFSWPTYWFTDEWMLNAGWCPFEIRWLEDKFTHTNMCCYYLGLTGRPYGVQKNHSSCTWESCSVDQIDDQTYRTKHIPNHCSCADAVDENAMQQVKLLVSQRKTPTLTLSEQDGTGALEVKVHNSGIQNPYVAISHVWSDGLGNHQRNSLPWCQMLRLQRAVDKLYGASERPVPFWIDTICVPLEPLERKMAIIGLKRTYEEADRVLVLDSTLQELPEDLDSIETLIRIAGSSWMRRLWTFQEGALSKSLHFQIANRALTHDDMKARRQGEWLKHVTTLCAQHRSRQGTLDLEELRSQLKPFLQGASEYEDPLFFEADHEVRKCRNDLKHIEEDSALLDALIENIKWRTTSRPEDEFICLATLLRRDFAQVMSCSYDEKMKWLFLSLERVSVPIIFHARPRIQEPGYRWIPKSLLNTGAALQIRGDTQRGKPSPHGLEVRYPGLLLFPDESFYQSEARSPVFLWGNDGARAYVIQAVEPNPTSRANFRGLRLGMIFEDFEDRSMEYVPVARAILVVLTDERQDALTARIESPVIFRIISGRAIPPDSCYVEAKALPRTQAWQVG